MSDILVTVGTTDLYTSSIFPTTDTVWPCTDTIYEFDVSQLWLNDSGLTIDHYTDGRSTAAFTVLDSAGAYTFYERQQVLIRSADNALRFGGVVQSCNTFRIPGTTIKFHSIEAADYTAILDWRMIDYSAENQLAGDAVQAILDEYLAEEGITAGYIEDGNLLTEISIGNKSALQGLQKLAEACGFVVYLDYDLRLYFHSRTLYAAEWGISDGEDIISGSFSITRKNDAYRNTEIMIGGYEETDLQEESWIGDGTTKTFPLAYPCNRFSTLTVNGSSKTIGQKGVDSGANDAYYALQSETLTFEEAPANGSLIVATYYGLWRAKSKAEDLTEIANNASRQGFGSGKVEHITIDEAMNSIVGAGEYANAKLAEYGVDGIQVTYKTRREGLAAGVLQHIEYEGLDHDVLICHVNETIKDGDTEYTVEGCYGPVQEDWDNFLNSAFQLVYQVREGIEEGTGVTKLYNFSHTFYVEDLEEGKPNPFVKVYADENFPEDDSLVLGGGDVCVDDPTWPCFDPEDRTLYIEFWNDGSCIFRKLHTSTPDMTENDEFHSYSFISPAEGIGQIDEVVFWGGNSATSEFGTGVELFRANFVHLKTILESLQLNATYVNGDY